MSTRIALPIGLCLLAFSATVALSQGQAKSYRTVLQVTADAPADWEAILGNIEHLRDALGAENVQVEVVAHGKGIGMVLQSNQGLAERMKKQSEGRVVFEACRNTMKKKGLTEKDLLPFVTTVDSGVAQVVRRQAEGWTYIRYGN